MTSTRRWGTGLVMVIASAALVGGCSGEPAATTGPPAMVEIRIVAKDVAFVPATASATAGVPLHLVLDNRDPGIPHNLALMANGSTKLAETEIVTGPASVAVDVPGLIPGVYQFVCTIHPSMVTPLTIGG
jgi:plastocyanin